MNKWVAGARPRTLPVSAAPVFVGTCAAAQVADDVIWWRAVAALAVAIALQIGVNYANDYSDGVKGTDAERRGPLRPEHLALVEAAHARGELVMAGPLAEPADGGVFVFNVDGPSVIEEFVEKDPYVREGMVTRWRVRPWTVVIGGERPA